MPWYATPIFKNFISYFSNFLLVTTFIKVLFQDVIHIFQSFCIKRRTLDAKPVYTPGRLCFPEVKFINALRIFQFLIRFLFSLLPEVIYLIP